MTAAAPRGNAGRAAPPLRAESREALAGLERDVSIDIFVTPT